MKTYNQVSLLFFILEVSVLVPNIILACSGSFRDHLDPANSQLYILSTIIDILTYLNSFATTRIPLNASKDGPPFLISFIELFPRDSITGTFLLTFLHLFHFTFAHDQLLLNLIILANRFSLAFHKVYAQKFWTQWSWPLVLGAIIYSIAMSWPIIWNNESYYEYKENQDRYQLTTTTPRELYYFPLGFTSVIVTVSNTILMIKTISRIFRFKKANISVPKCRLFLFVMISVVADYFLTIITVFNVYLTIWPATSESDFLFGFSRAIPYVIPFASDSLTLTRPILFLLFNWNRKTGRKPKGKSSVEALNQRFRMNKISPVIS